MFSNPSTVHISIVTAIGAFAVSAVAIICGYLLIASGTYHGETGLSVSGGGWQVNFYSFVPGVAFAFFGAGISWRALSVLIAKSPRA